VDTGLLIVRLVVGLTLAAHGVQKLFGWFDGGGLSKTATEFEKMGYRPGTLFATADGLAEGLGGLFLAVGLLTPLAAAAIMCAMLGAALSVHIKRGFWVTNGGYEYPMLIGGVAAGVAFTGAGIYSIDHLLGWNLSGVWWGELAILLALVASIPVEAYRRQRIASPAHA
jgi:putative oxidoreductase